MDLVGRFAPALRALPVLAQLGQTATAVARHPAEELRGGEVPGLAAHLPDAVIGLAPVRYRLLDLALEDRPDALVERVPRAGVQVDRIEQRAPNVMLLLAVGGVADPDRPGPVIAGEVLELCLLELSLATDAVEDLQILLA